MQSDYIPIGSNYPAPGSMGQVHTVTVQRGSKGNRYLLIGFDSGTRRILLKSTEARAVADALTKAPEPDRAETFTTLAVVNG